MMIDWLLNNILWGWEQKRAYVLTVVSWGIGLGYCNASTCLLGGTGGDINLPLSVPFNPGSRPVFFGSRPFAFFRLRNITQCCIIFPFSPASRHLGNPASRPLFSRLPYTSRPLFSRPPAPLSPPPLAYLEVLVVPFKDGDPTDCCTQQLSRGFCTLYA